MARMAKRKKPTDGNGEEPKKRYPSREKTRYVALPLELYEALEGYAAKRSDEDDTRSVSWAARVAIRRFLVGEGLWPPPHGKKP